LAPAWRPSLIKPIRFKQRRSQTQRVLNGPAVWLSRRSGAGASACRLLARVSRGGREAGGFADKFRIY
jgi:hypothetical protein